MDDHQPAGLGKTLGDRGPNAVCSAGNKGDSGLIRVKAHELTKIGSCGLDRKGFVGKMTPTAFQEATPKRRF